MHLREKSSHSDGNYTLKFDMYWGLIDLNKILGKWKELISKNDSN